MHTIDLTIRINSILDAIPRRDVRIGTYVLSPYFVLAGFGYAVGSCAMLILAGLTGYPLTLALVWPLLILATFVALGVARKAITGAESHALLGKRSPVLNHTRCLKTGWLRSPW